MINARACLVMGCEVCHTTEACSVERHMTLGELMSKNDQNFIPWFKGRFLS